MKFLVVISLLSFLLTNCRVAEKNITGTYHYGKGRLSRLSLNDDKTFELALLNPATDSLFFHANTSMNFYTNGNWEYKKSNLVLKCATRNPNSPTVMVMDSISRFTNISSFNFWNRYGDPVPIRYIIISSSHPKPHFGNSLYFFAQDFKQTDTLRFYFDGYPPFDFPGSVPSTSGNNTHKIVLSESYKPAALPDIKLLVRKNKLRKKGSRLVFLKSK